ncbi:MAG: oligopeptide transporter, OPT family [Candidatus Eremiobacteraeota bacterium]|nr:oligopeptide transporter, OPT family [Candidatus Eremiobacteraeota bacterium]
MEHASGAKGLPANAYSELKPGETYEPIVPAESDMQEVTPRSVITGVLMALIFSGAAAFLGLKIGNVFEAAIPIAILAVGISYLMARRRKSTILENVIIQSIGASSGAVVAGAIFTLPALLILKGNPKYGIIDVNFFQIFMASLLGGILGIVFLIFFRKYFVSDMHGKFPFPEGTATTEVLVTGEEGGDQAKVLGISMLVASVYEFCVYTLEAWRETFSTRLLKAGAALADQWKLVFKINVTSAVLGMGYIVGLKYAAIICAGSFFAWYIVIPLIAHFGHYLPVSIPPAPEGVLISSMGEDELFKYYARTIGIGGIACAGIIGIIKSSGIILQAFTLGFKEIFQKRSADAEGAVKRTQKDLPMIYVFSIIAITLIITFFFFQNGVLAKMQNATTLALIALLVVIVISFLFTSVAARAIAIVGTNPVSGMTLMTLILSSIILVQAGLKGPYGMMAALLIGGVVCTSLSMSGSFITDLKIGYWIGATPYNQQRFKFLGTLVAAFAVAAVIMLLNTTYGFVEGPGHPADKVLPAPQANAMAAVIETLMSDAPVPWLLYAVGIILTLILESIGIPPLAFVLGVYIPLDLNTPILAGGILAHLIEKSHPDPAVGKKRKEKGTLIASGYIAGGAIIGVVSAILKFYKVNWSLGIAEKDLGGWAALVMFLVLGAFTYWYACRGEHKSAPEDGNAAE